MSKINDWVTKSNNNYRMWQVFMWVGLAIVLALGIGSTILFLIEPSLVTGIPALFVFVLWLYLLLEGKR